MQTPGGILMVDDERDALPFEEQRPMMADRGVGHCYDAEKCNADTFCECPCRSCTRYKRGEFNTRS